MKIVLFNEAKNQKLKRYFTGIPCKHGHLSERLTSNRCCIECQKIAEQKYANSKRGKENKRIKQKRYFLKNA